MATYSSLLGKIPVTSNIPVDYQVPHNGTMYTYTYTFNYSTGVIGDIESSLSSITAPIDKMISYLYDNLGKAFPDSQFSNISINSTKQNLVVSISTTSPNWWTVLLIVATIVLVAISAVSIVGWIAIPAEITTAAILGAIGTSTVLFVTDVLPVLEVFCSDINYAVSPNPITGETGIQSALQNSLGYAVLFGGIIFVGLFGLSRIM
jgi:hypothetical protein